MMFRTHLVFAFLIGIIFSFLSQGKIILFFSLLLISAGLPDIDNPKSKFGRKIKIISWIVNLLFKHRGIFHSLFFVFGISFLGFWFFGEVVFWGLFLGSLSHLVADSFTLNGISFFYPFKFFTLKGFVKTNGKLEFVIFYFLFIIDILLLINLA